MLIRDEISKCEIMLLQNSGLREKLLYWFLTKSKNINLEKVPIEELDKICFSAFVDSNIDVKKEIQRNIHATPVRGIHFSSNLILQIAFALRSENAKLEYLKDFYQKQSLKEQFVISTIFNEFKFPVNLKAQNEIERIISEVFINKDFKKAEKILLPAFQSIEDLIDLYAFIKTYEELLIIHPANLILQNYKALNSEIENLISVIKKRINFCVNFISMIVATGVLFFVPYFILQKWSSWNLEPIITGLFIAIPFFWGILYTLYKLNPTWFNVINKLKDWLLKLWFRNKKANYDFIKVNLIQSNTE